MAREFPIHNGRMTTDLDANGHKIKNLPPGSGFTQVQSDWGQTDTTAPDFIKNKPPIPAPVTIDPSLSPTSENPVKSSGIWNAIWGTLTALPTGFTSLYRWCVAQLAGKLNRSEAEEGFTEWRVENIAPLYEFVSCSYSRDTSTWTVNLLYFPSGSAEPLEVTEAFLDDADATELGGTVFSLSRTKMRPTKTSELTNDGDGTSLYATVAQIAQKASITDLPYAMYTPQLDAYTSWDVEWTGSSERATMEWVGNGWHLNGSEDGTFLGGDETSTHFEGEAPSFGFDTYSATRSLAYGLHDRANNLIDAQTGNVTLTLPPFVAGKVRDLLVACTIGLDANDEPWSVIFQGGDGEEISFKAEGDDAASATFPVPGAAGDWWYSLTERAPHVFAVSLKQLQSVSQTQGGV